MSDLRSPRHDECSFFVAIVPIAASGDPMTLEFYETRAQSLEAARTALVDGECYVYQGQIERQGFAK